jgi:F-type H+-transporting ATPase subunit b
MHRGFCRHCSSAGRGLFLFASVFLCLAGPLFAQEEGSPAETTTGQVFHWLNFAIIAALIVYGLRKAVPAFRAHADSIAELIAEGRRAREEAQRRKAEVERRMADLPAEIERLKAQAKKESAAEIERIRAMARDEAEKIERAAQTEIQAAERASWIALKKLAAGMVIARATALLADRITPEANSALFRGFLKGLRENVN